MDALPWWQLRMFAEKMEQEFSDEEDEPASASQNAYGTAEDAGQAPSANESWMAEAGVNVRELKPAG